MSIGIRRKLRNYLIAGTLALIPLTITYLVLTFLFQKMDSLFMPLIVRLLILGGANLAPGDRIPGIGLLVTLVLIFFTGLMTRNLVGRKAMDLGEWALQRIPLVSSIYFSSKQLVDAFSLPGRKAFREVVLVEYPRRGIYSVGFITSEFVQPYEEGGKPLYSIFVPTTPNPTSGMLILASEAEFIRMPLSVEDGIKLIVSGGILTPRPAIPPAAGKEGG